MRAIPAQSNAPPTRRWAWRVGRLFKIDVYIHVTFPLLLIWFGSMAYSRGGAAQAATDVLLVVVLFGCVVLHELGHALTARRFGISTRDITLYPIGGVARLQRMPTRPIEELLVAIAGPMVNVAIALLIVIVGGIRSLAFPSFDAVWTAPFLGQLLWLNIALAVFNLLPAFPMDGGRVLRAVLAFRLEPAKATEIAARVGQVGAIGLGILGWFYNPILILIAVFVWFGANQEASMMKVRGLLHGLPVSSAMLTEFETLGPDSTLGEASARLLKVSQQDFPIVEDGVVIGVLTRKGLVAGLNSEGPSARVEGAMERSFLIAHPSDLLESLVEQLQSASCSTVPVLSGERLVGLITTENVGELLMVRQAVSEARATG